MLFGRFLEVLGSGSGLKMLLGPARSFSPSRFFISSILNPFPAFFLHFWASPIFAYFCQNLPRGQFHIFWKPPFCSAPNYLAPIETCASRFERWWESFAQSHCMRVELSIFPFENLRIWPKVRVPCFSLTNGYLCQRQTLHFLDIQYVNCYGIGI